MLSVGIVTNERVTCEHACDWTVGQAVGLSLRFAVHHALAPARAGQPLGASVRAQDSLACWGKRTNRDGPATLRVRAEGPPAIPHQSRMIWR